MSDLSANLVCQFKCDDNAASTVVIDEKGNNGVSVRNTSLMHVAGKIGGALDFNGTSDYVDTGQTFESVFQDSFSISLWFKPNQNPEDDWIFGIADTGEDDMIAIRRLIIYETNYVGFYHYGSAVEAVKGFSLNEWYFLTCVAEATSPTTSKFYIYINGVLANSTNGNPLSGYRSDFTASTVFIGSNNSDGSAGFLFSGSLDDVRIYNKALTAAEVLELYNEANASNGGNIYTQIFASIFGTVHSVYNSLKNSIFGD